MYAVYFCGYRQSVDIKCGATKYSIGLQKVWLRYIRECRHVEAAPVEALPVSEEREVPKRAPIVLNRILPVKESRFYRKNGVSKKHYNIIGWS